MHSLTPTDLLGPARQVANRAEQLLADIHRAKREAQAIRERRRVLFAELFERIAILESPAGVSPETVGESTSVVLGDE